MNPGNVIDGGDGINTEPNAAGVAEALAMGITEALIKAFPELQAVFNEFAKGNLAKARMDYFNTKYYKDLIDTSATRKTNRETRPGVYAQEFDAWKQQQIVRLAGKGIRVTPDIEGLLETSYLSGDTDLQLDIKILDSGKFGSIGGSTLGAINGLKDYAYEQGVNNLLNASYWDKISSQLFAGTITGNDIQKEIDNIAMSAYPAYSKGIAAGRSFNMQTSANRQLVSNFLEVDIDTVGNDHPVFKQTVNWINPKTNMPEIMPLWEAEKLVKSTDQWLYTKNARETFDGLGLRVLRDMRLA